MHSGLQAFFFFFALRRRPCEAFCIVFISWLEMQGLMLFVSFKERSFLLWEHGMEMTKKENNGAAATALTANQSIILEIASKVSFFFRNQLSAAGGA